MEVIIRPTSEAATELAVNLVARELAAKPDGVFGLATGRTMETFYKRLVQLHRDTGLDFSRCRTFNLDEYAGLPPDHPNSYRYFMQDRLFRNVNINPSRTHLPNGAARDAALECANYERLIAESGGIDLLLLGIGNNGHLGFNEPWSGFDSRTRVEKLSPETRRQNTPLFSHPDEMPQHAITMGIATILEARRCLLLAIGPEKAGIVARAIEGPITRMVPASVLQWHPACTMVLDAAAAGNLTSTTGELAHFGQNGHNFAKRQIPSPNLQTNSKHQEPIQD